ncbi:MAG: response regulator transcription factor [Polyangia bacterium]
MRLLLVEDDHRLLRTLNAGLSEAGLVVDAVEDGPPALAALRAHRYDACVLDLGLPSGDGLAVLQAARAEQIATPILILTARDAVTERVRGLDLGADDYLLKPFAFAELLARLRVLMRRGSPPRASLLRHGALSLDLAAHIARVADQPVELTQKQRALLEYLMVHAGEVVTRGMLLSAVWGYSFDPGTNVVDVHIAQLRRRLEQAGFGGSIETVRGVGYRLPAADAGGCGPDSRSGGSHGRAG